MRIEEIARRAVIHSLVQPVHMLPGANSNPNSIEELPERKENESPVKLRRFGDLKDRHALKFLYIVAFPRCKEWFYVDRRSS